MTWPAPQLKGLLSYDGITGIARVQMPSGCVVEVPGTIVAEARYTPRALVDFLRAKEREQMVPTLDLSAPGWDANGAPTP